MGSKSVKRESKVILDASVSSAIAKAVNTRKVAALTIGAAGVLAGAALAFSITPANIAKAAEVKDSQVVQSDAQKGEQQKNAQQANDKQVQKKNVTETPENQMGGGLPSKKDVKQTKVEKPEVEKTQVKQTEEKQDKVKKTEDNQPNANKAEAEQPKLKSAASPFMLLATNTDDGDDEDYPMPPIFPNTDLNFDKPVIKDPEHLTDSEKLEIRKRVAKANNVPVDKVTFGDNRKIVINFGQIIPGQDYTDTINLDDAIIKEIAESNIAIPSGDDAVPVYNPIAFSNDEFNHIKEAVYKANKNNNELGLTYENYSSAITVKSKISGDLTRTGKANEGISNGMAENTITVTIKTDKAYVQFTSNIKNSKLTRAVDIRKDYKLEWTKQQMDGRSTDEGFSWSSDNNTLIYRYDATKAQKFSTEDVIKYLKATPKDANSGLRTIIGGETLASEGRNGKGQRSNMHYLLDAQDNPTTSLTMGNMSGPYWNGNPAIDNSDRNLDDHNSDVQDYHFGNDAHMKLAAKSGKVYPAHLYLSPYDYSYFKLAVSVNSINLLFVPQPSHDKDKLKASIDEYTTAQVGDKKVPTKSKYYNASDTLRNNYDTALSAANTLYTSVENTAKENLTEQQKADIDNAAIKLNKAYEALNGDPTDKKDLNKDITDQGTAATAQGAATGTHATDRYKNVANPKFKKADGSLDTDKNGRATQAKTAYDEALEEANKVKENQYATQKEVNAAKEKLDKARRALDDFETNKDKLSEVIQSSKVNTGGNQGITNADPAYQNASDSERQAYDEAVKKAQELFGDPNASQAEVDLALENLKNAKKAIDAKATNKSALDAQVLQSHDHDGDKKSVFYKNGTYNKYFDDNLPEGVNKEEAKQYASKYDEALQKAKEVINNPKATQAQVDEALNNLKTAEENLHKLKTNSYDLIQTLANNFSGNKLPAYFNAYEESQNGADAAKKTQAGKDFVAYNDAYAEAKNIKQKIDAAKAGTSTYSQQEIDAAKAKLDKARDAIVTYATKPSALQTSADQDDVTQNTTAYKNAKALAGKAGDGSLTVEEKAKVDAAKKIVDEYTAALAAAKKVLANQVDKDKNANGEVIDDSVDGTGDPSSATFLNGVQKHPENKALQKDVDEALKRLDAARAALSTYATKKDDLRKSVDADADTKQLPQYKNTDSPVFNDADGSKNTQASAAKTAYDQALNSAKNVLSKQDATQVEVDAALKNLDTARKALDAYNTDFAKLKESVGKNGELNADGSAKSEGTLTSDAYRNASNPQFMKNDGSGNLVPDADRNNAAAAAKTAYDFALAKANELLAKSKDANTPAEERPTQAQVNDALAALEAARTGLDVYKTNSADLKAETEKSQAEGATDEPAADKFEHNLQINNAKYLLEKLKGNQDSLAYKDAKDKLDAYNAALKKARELVNNAEDQTLSKHPTQQEVDDALAALKKAKSDIENDPQFNTDKSSLQNEVDGKDKDGKVITPKFEDTPEFNNAAGSAAATAYTKALEDANKVLSDTNATQKQVDDALKALQDAKKAISQFSTDKSKLRNEVEGKDSDGNIITPKFNESAEYKNAEAKANATPADEDAKKDLENYTNALNEANSVLNDSSASQSAVDAALKRLQEAKKKIADSNKTDKSKLKDEADSDADFRKSPYFIIGSRDDIDEYEKALAEANRVLKDPNATQAEVDAALKRLAAAKNKINNPFGRGGNGSGSESGADFGSDSENGFGYGYGNGYGHFYDSDGLGDSSNGSADKSALRAEVAEAENINAGNANSADANAYFDALSEARSVLNDPNATQAQVDAALRKLQAAKAALLNSLSGASGHKIAKTGAATGLFAGFAAIFAGLGAAGVASRRRKHSNE
ncbi:FIVAR domain-containing protein [Gardnerella greenwoodii]|uniref:FIVAR domain-containing protein n=1 Tax=Gardnerella greenwoodii TaxID=2914925 RepID=UPI0002FF5F80|nr:FIVAR domain-containing protein [Gardnerella greenwoodii]